MLEWCGSFWRRDRIELRPIKRSDSTPECMCQRLIPDRMPRLVSNCGLAAPGRINNAGVFKAFGRICGAQVLSFLAAFTKSIETWAVFGSTCILEVRVATAPDRWPRASGRTMLESSGSKHPLDAPRAFALPSGVLELTTRRGTFSIARRCMFEAIRRGLDRPDNTGAHTAPLS